MKKRQLQHTRKNRARQTPTITNQPREFLTKKEVAELLRCTTACIDNWMRDKIIPYFKIGKRSVRFRHSDIIARLENTSLVTKCE